MMSKTEQLEQALNLKFNDKELLNLYDSQGIDPELIKEEAIKLAKSN